MRKITKKDKRRLRLLFLIFIPLLIYFFYNMTSYWMQIFNNISEKKRLTEVYNEILEEEENLKSTIIKLQDEEYVARYAREKYLYSKDGELIIKIK